MGWLRRTSCALGIALSLSALHVYAQEPELAPQCTFRGEVIRAQNYEDVLLLRGERRIPVEPYTPLFPGDIIRVTAQQTVLIRDVPNAEPRAIDARDGSVTIQQAESCDLSPGWDEIFGAVLRQLAIWARPVPPLPSSATPRADRPSPIELHLPAESLIGADLTRIAVVWSGPDARVLVTSPTSDAPLVDARSTGTPFIFAPLSRSLVPGERLDLAVTTADDRVQRTLRVVRPIDVPRPPGTVPAVSQSERTIHAIWLLLETPSEWHVHALSLLGVVAQADYVGWKAWRAVLADEQNNLAAVPSD